jgi:hypothetical protein
VTEDHDRPALLGGLWALLGGGLAIAVLLVILHPVTRQEDCSNYLAAGNASAFANSKWDFYLPVTLLGWVLLVALEQALPTSWRHRGGWAVTARSGGAVMLSVVGSCCVLAPLLLVCH